MGVLIGLVAVFATIIVLCGLLNYAYFYAWPVARGRIDATWPMVPSEEGFADVGETPKRTLSQWLASPEVLTKPAVGECPGRLLDAADYKGIKDMYKSYDLLDDVFPGKPEPRVAMGPTSQQCYEVDWTRGLERAGSYAQRTNNYKHGPPESCSAPNHDLILDFYKVEPIPGPYQV